MYRRIKKIVIVPLLIITLMSCMIYTDYRKPMEVHAVVLTGDPFLDIFAWVLELVGFTGKNKESQDQALHNFVQYIYKELHDLKGITEQLEESRKEQFDAECKKWRSDMENKWSTMSEKERMINCFNSYTEKEFFESGTNKSYYNWLKENYVNCSSNPFAEKTAAIPLNMIIANAIRNGKISSKYTAEQWEKSGTLGILVMSVRDWFSSVGKQIYDDATYLFNSTLGSVFNIALLGNFAWYQYLMDIDFQTFVDTSGGTFQMTDPIPTMNAARTTFFSNIPKSYAVNLANLGSKYVLDINMYEYNDSEQSMSIKFIDIPDDTAKIKYTKTDCGWRGYSYSYDCYDSSGNLINSDNTFISLFTYYKDTTKDWTMNYSVNGKYEAWDPFNFKYQHYVYNSSFGSVDNMDLMIPFGLSDVEVDTEGYVYTPSASRLIGADSEDEDNSVPVSIVKTGNDTLADRVAGTVIDLDDVQDIPIDEVIDTDVTEDRVAEREQENEKTITDSLTRAEEREKEEAKPDESTDLPDVKDEDLDKYKINVTDIFPFCIPFDIYRFFECLAADPVAPKFTIPVIVENSFGIPEYSIEIDFAKFNSVAAILRKMELLGFCVGLAFVTNKLIKH